MSHHSVFDFYSSCLRTHSDAASVEEITHALSLGDIKQRQIHVERTCALTGERVAEAIEELARMVKNYKRAKDVGADDATGDAKRRRKHSKVR